MCFFVVVVDSHGQENTLLFVPAAAAGGGRKPRELCVAGVRSIWCQFHEHLPTERHGSNGVNIPS
jgi:hypothetical protein